MTRSFVYWSIAIIGFAIALPLLLWSMLAGEVPLSPEFGPDSTLAGTTILAVFALFSITPILLVGRKAGRPLPKKMVN